MKITKYILLIISVSILWACNDSTVYPDVKNLPVKALDLNISNIRLAYPMPDGSMVVPVDKDSALAVARVSPDGSFTLSETLPLKYATYFIANSAGESLMYNYIFSDDLGYSVIKLDEYGSIAYNGQIEGYVPITLLDNGDIAYIKQESVNGSLTEKPVMHIVGKNFKYVMARDFYCSDAFAYDDKILMYNYSGDYCIFNTNGTYVNKGSLGRDIYKIFYADGFLYLITIAQIDFTIDELLEQPEETGVTEWGITKMDDQGNQIFTSTVSSLALFGNFSTDEKNIIVTGSISTDYKKGEGYGAIFLLNKDSGTLEETIALDYVDCDLLPIYIVPNKKAGYIVYTLRRNNFDEVTTELKDFAHIDNGKLYIYTTNDLHKLQINNNINNQQ